MSDEKDPTVYPAEKRWLVEMAKRIEILAGEAKAVCSSEDGTPRPAYSHWANRLMEAQMAVDLFVKTFDITPDVVRNVNVKDGWGHLAFSYVVVEVES